MLIVSGSAGADDTIQPGTSEGENDAAQEIPQLLLAPESEQLVLNNLLRSNSWTRRAIAVMRLERYGCNESLALLLSLLNDADWQVRSFAIRALARRGINQQQQWFQTESNPRVLRTALRHRYSIGWDWFEPGVRQLAAESDLEQKMLAVELGAASDDPKLKELAKETARTIILRMDRGEAGSLSPRLSEVTGAYNYLRRLRWQLW